MASDAETAVAEGPLRNRIVDTQMLDPNTIELNPANWRLHPQPQQDAVEGVLEEVGWVQGVILNQRTGNLLDGHLRVKLARKHNEKEIPVQIVDLSPEEENLILAVLDPLAGMAGANEEKLRGLLENIETDNTQVQALLESVAQTHNLEIMALVDGDGDQEVPMDLGAELEERWGTRSGQLWQLGNHKVICGDCTNENDVGRVMGTEKARLTVTSPPYFNLRTYEIGDFDWHALARDFIRLAFEIAAEPSDILINLGMVHDKGKLLRYWEPWLDYCEEVGHPLYGWYIWDQGSGFPGDYHGKLARSHEFIFHFSIGHQRANKWVATKYEWRERGAKGMKSRKKDGSFKAFTSPKKVGQPYKIPDSVIRVRRAGISAIETQVHPAVFPVDFASFLIKTWGGAGSIVYEPFLGSGSTLIACESLDRRCRGVELEPKYLAVAIERWHQMTGQQPELLEG